MFAVISVNIKEFEYWKFVMARDEKDYDKFVEKVLEHSLWNTGKKPKYGKQMLMLSTCDNGKGDDWRIVVVERVLSILNKMQIEKELNLEGQGEFYVRNI